MIRMLKSCWNSSLVQHPAFTVLEVLCVLFNMWHWSFPVLRTITRTQRALFVWKSVPRCEGMLGKDVSCDIEKWLVISREVDLETKKLRSKGVIAHFIVDLSYNNLQEQGAAALWRNSVCICTIRDILYKYYYLYFHPYDIRNIKTPISVSPRALRLSIASTLVPISTACSLMNRSLIWINGGQCPSPHRRLPWLARALSRR
jgi:hypothetical protein